MDTRFQFEEVRRNQNIRRPAGQLSFAGLDAHRTGETVRRPGTARKLDAPAGATVPRGRRGRRGRRPSLAPSSGSVLTPNEQMDLLRANGHLLKPREREWVEKIEATMAARGDGAHLSDRQTVVICDIFDRFRARVGR